MDEVDRLNQLALESLDRREPEDTAVADRCEVFGCAEDAERESTFCAAHLRDIEGLKSWPE